jgi:hypothetical protein
MSDFLKAVKADLLDRRLLPILALLGIALAAALAYAVLGGGSTPTTPGPAPASTTPPAGSGALPIAVTPAQPSSEAAVAETTSGSTHQHAGASRNPFTPLPGTTTTTAATKAARSSATSSPSSTSTPSKRSSGSGGTAPASTPKPAPSKPQFVIHYHVTAQFGVVPSTSAQAPQPQPAPLKTFENMKLNAPLPSKDNSQVVFLGVLLRTGTEAVFALTGEAILHGSAACLPTPTQCRSIELKAGQSEQLESVEANGTPVTYELKLIRITRSVTSASAAAHTAPAAADADAVGPQRHKH